MKIHNPIAIQKDSVIFLRYYERPEPTCWGKPDCCLNKRCRYLEWQSSFKEVPFNDQEWIGTYTLGPFYDSLKFCPRPLYEIADRIEIINGFAIIKPEEEQESQEDIFKSLLKIWNYHMKSQKHRTELILQNFEIKRKKS